MPLELQPYAWPEGKRCAVVFSADVDAESPLVWKQRGKPISAIAELEHRRFGPRTGLARILALLEELGIKGSFYVPGYVAEAHPDILPGLLRRGHEIGLHGYHHELVHQLSEQENAEVLDRCIEVFTRQVGQRSLGYRSPAWELTPALHGQLLERKLAYDSSLMGFDHPYTLEGLPEVPVQWLVDDAIYFRFLGGGQDWGPPVNPQQVLQSWIEEFEGQYDCGGLFMLTIHPWISGRAQRIRMLRTLFTHILRRSDVWVTTADELARYHADSANAQRFVSTLDLPSTDF